MPRAVPVLRNILSGKSTYMDDHGNLVAEVASGKCFQLGDLRIWRFKTAIIDGVTPVPADSTQADFAMTSNATGRGTIFSSNGSVWVGGTQGSPGPPGNGLPAFYFSYGDATPAIIFTPDANWVILSISLIVLTPFNGVGANASIGTTASPDLLMDEDESDLSVGSAYEANPMETIPNGTPVKVFITPGAGATAGRCMVLIEYALA